MYSAYCSHVEQSHLDNEFDSHDQINTKAREVDIVYLYIDVDPAKFSIPEKNLIDHSLIKSLNAQFLSKSHNIKRPSEERHLSTFCVNLMKACFKCFL